MLASVVPCDLIVDCKEARFGKVNNMQLADGVVCGGHFLYKNFYVRNVLPVCVINAYAKMVGGSLFRVSVNFLSVFPMLVAHVGAINYALVKSGLFVDVVNSNFS